MAHHATPAAGEPATGSGVWLDSVNEFSLMLNAGNGRSVGLDFRNQLVAAS